MNEPKSITKQDMISRLKDLGVRAGDILFVHSSLASFGRVEGGADAVIDALLEAVGATGTVMVPTFGCSDPIFDPARSETGLGAIPSRFWKRKNAIRSRHPLASVAAIGARSRWLVEGHEKARIAHGEGTPYMRLAEAGGRVLLLGVDQDRSTFLHTAEELAFAPYLKPAGGIYLDEEGKPVTDTWAHFPGPHRNFIGLQEWLESKGLIRKVLIGSCLAQVMPARELLAALSERIAGEPGLFISKNPNLPDGIRQQADVYRALLRREVFRLAADSQFAGRYLEEIAERCLRFGIDQVVLSFVMGTPWEKISTGMRKWYLDGLGLAGIAVAAIRPASERLGAADIASLCQEARAPTVILSPALKPELAGEVAAKGLAVCIQNARATGEDMVHDLDGLSRRGIRASAAFDPLAFVQAGENPFLTTYTKNRLKGRIGALYLNDGLATGERAPLEQGLAEVKELISILRCRSFSGLMVLQSESTERFPQAAEKFFSMLKELGAWPEP